MRAVVFDRFGGPDVLVEREVPDPAPGPGELVVTVRACGINHLDLWVRKGLRDVDLAMPHILGCDVVGEIHALGEGVAGHSVGDRVWVHPTLSCGACEACRAGNDHLCRRYDVLGRRRNGGYAERVVIPATNALPYPSNLSWVEAAAMPLVFLTAWHMLVTRARLGEGETCLVIGAGSGVGSAAIQVAKHLGARVIATAGSAEKRERATQLGADATIDHATQDIASEARALTDGRGVNVVFEHVGGRVFEAGVAALARDGRLVTCGATDGNRVSLDINLLFGRHLALYGSWMGNRSESLAVLERVRAGTFRPVIDSVLPLGQARKAHERIEARMHFGKIVLTP